MTRSSSLQMRFGRQKFSLPNTSSSKLPHEVHVLIADLHEDGAGLGEEVAGDGESVAEVGEV